MYNILITGGTGSLGSQLVKHFSAQGHRVTVFSRDGHKQQRLQEQCPKAHFILGDICDYAAVERACVGQSYVIHAAAQKIVYQGEANPDEFVRVNIQGSQTVVKACEATDVSIALLISSDKAVNPVNLYGKTKAVAEDCFLGHNFSVLRYGNVVDSAGSFLRVWKRMLSIDPYTLLPIRGHATRFFLTISDAVSLVEKSIWGVNVPSLLIPRKLQAFSVFDVAKHMAGNNIEFVPTLPGEKLHEVLLADAEQGERFSDSLAVVHKGYDGSLNRSDFSSETAEGISPAELLERVEI